MSENVTTRLESWAVLVEAHWAYCAWLGPEHAAGSLVSLALQTTSAASVAVFDVCCCCVHRHGCEC